MARNSLFPAFIRINYRTVYGLHSMTIPTVDYQPNVDPSTGGDWLLRGANLPTPAHAAVTALVNLMRPFFKASTQFSDYTIYKLANQTAAPQPVYSNSLNIVGTSTSTAWDKATQQTFTFRAEDFTTFKIVLLDSPVASFDRIAVASAFPTVQSFVTYVTAPESWLSSRGGGRPTTFLQIAVTLNEKLRRSYKMN